MPEPAQAGGAQPDGDLGPQHGPQERPGLLAPVPGQVEALVAVEVLVAHLDPGDPVHPVGAHIVADPADQIPDPALEHQAVRLDPAGHLPVAASVAQLHHPVAPDRPGQLRQPERRRGLPEPARHVQVEPLPGAGRRVAQGGWQRGEHLQLGGRDRVGEPHLAGRPGQPGEEQRLRLVPGQPGQPGAVAAEQAVTAGPPPVGVDRHTRRGERQHVPVDGPLGDLQLPASSLAVIDSARLQQQQQRDQSGRAHPPILPGAAHRPAEPVTAG